MGVTTRTDDTKSHLPAAAARRSDVPDGGFADAAYLTRLAWLCGAIGKRRVADVTGVSTESVRRYLNGDAPSLSFAARLARETGVSIDWLLFGIEPWNHLVDLPLPTNGAFTTMGCQQTPETAIETKCENGTWWSRVLVKWVCSDETGPHTWVEWRPQGDWSEDGGDCTSGDVSSVPTGNEQTRVNSAGQPQRQAEWQYTAVGTPNGTVTWLEWHDS